MGRTRNLIFLLLFSLAPLHSYAQQKEPIGRVLVTRGNVEAVDLRGNSRALQRRSELFEGDSITTGLNGFAQIRMIDGAQISLKSASEFMFREYRFDGDPTTPDTVHLELKKGGFRTITGTVTNSDNDTYILVTPDANVGVRGTTFECTIDSGSTYCGVSNGGITVSNGVGSVDLGLAANYDYAKVQQGMPPEPLMQQPPQLGQSQVNLGINQNQSTANFSSQNSNTVTVIRNSSNSSTLPPAIGSTTSNGPGFPAPIPITVKPYKAGKKP